MGEDKQYKILTGLSLEVCQKRIIENITPVADSVCIPLGKAGGQVTGEDVYAPFAVPPFPKSAMDGYAVRALDTTKASRERPVRLKVIGELLAGDDSGHLQEKLLSDGAAQGRAVRVMTGAEIPTGFDAVIRQEDTDCGVDEVALYRSVKAFENYCPIGEELEKGKLVIPKGKRIGRTELGLLASLGCMEVSVKCPIKVSLISTGSELAKPTEALRPGQIYGNILPMLRYSLERMGCEIASEAVLADEEALISSEIQSAAKRADVIITTGGVSVGKKDLIPAVMTGLSAKKLFSHALIQPGTPTMASMYENKPILSLSGNPYAALAMFDYYFPYMAAQFIGCENFLPVVKKAVLAGEYKKINKQRRLVRAKYEDGKVRPADHQKASVIGNMADCNCYMDIEAERELETGDTVTVRMMPWD